jgi:hypothetical protein
MKYREHRGGYKDSMATVLEIQPTINALAVILKVPPLAVVVKPLCFDSRNGWDTHMVAVEGCAVGFTDGPCSEAENRRRK